MYSPAVPKAGSNISLQEKLISAKKMPNKGKNKKARTKNARKRELRRSARSTRPPQMRPMLSECAADYARALADPRGSPPTCCPDGRFPVPTEKLKVQARATFVVGTLGTGWVVMNPGGCAMSDKAALTTTTAAYAAAVVPLAAAGGTITVGSDSQFNSGNIGSGAQSAQYRVVAAGMYVKSLNPLQTVKGVVMCNTLNSHADQGGNTISNFRVETGEKEWSAPAITLDEEAVVLSGPPVHPSEFDFNSTVAGTAGTWTDTTVAGCMAIGVTGGTTGDSYDVQAYCLLEYTGGGADAIHSSPADPVGTANVARAMFEANQNQAGANATMRTQWPTSAEIVRRAASFLSQNSGMVMTAASAAAAAYAAPEVLAGKALLTGGRAATKFLMYRH